MGVFRKWGSDKITIKEQAKSLFFNWGCFTDGGFPQPGVLMRSVASRNVQDKR